MVSYIYPIIVNSSDLISVQLPDNFQTVSMKDAGEYLGLPLPSAEVIGACPSIHPSVCQFVSEQDNSKTY